MFLPMEAIAPSFEELVANKELSLLLKTSSTFATELLAGTK